MLINSELFFLIIFNSHLMWLHAFSVDNGWIAPDFEFFRYQLWENFVSLRAQLHIQFIDSECHKIEQLIDFPILLIY